MTFLERLYEFFFAPERMKATKEDKLWLIEDVVFSCLPMDQWYRVISGQLGRYSNWREEFLIVCRTAASKHKFTPKVKE